MEARHGPFGVAAVPWQSGTGKRLMTQPLSDVRQWATRR